MKLLKVVNTYVDDQVAEKGGPRFSSGVVLELEDGRFFQHNHDGMIVPLSEVSIDQEAND